MNFKTTSVELAAVFVNCISSEKVKCLIIGNVRLVLEYLLQYEDTIVYFCGCETWSLILRDGKV
jgi:hypothetical protein